MAEPQQLISAAAEFAKMRAEKRSKIVVGVDDTETNLKLLEATLVNAGYTFFGFPSAQACFEFIQRIEPRLILLDIQMPYMNGFDACRKLRQMPHLRHVPIAFLTARKELDDVTEGMAAGANDFIVKPFSPLNLLKRVEYWTGRGRVPLPNDPAPTSGG